MAKVVPVEAMGGYGNLVDLQLPPAYNLVAEPSTWDPNVNIFVPQLHSMAGPHDQRLCISRSVPTFYYEVGNDPPANRHD